MHSFELMPMRYDYVIQFFYLEMIWFGAESYWLILVDSLYFEMFIQCETWVKTDKST